MPLSDDQLRAMRPDDLLVLAIEEASETIQAACKAKRFGFRDHHPDRPDSSNIEELCAEAEQLAATVRILGAAFGVSNLVISERRNDAGKGAGEIRS